MKEAKLHLYRLVQDLCLDMMNQGIVEQIDFQGSSFEGLKTSASPLEFDCFIVLCGRPWAAPDDCPPGYEMLLPNNQGLAVQDMCDGSYLSPVMILRKFQSELQKSVNNLGQSDGMKLRTHGPAIQIDVHRNPTSSNCKPWYSVDMVPGFQVYVGLPDGYHLYIAKPYKFADLGVCLYDPELTWRRSFSIEEKEKLKDWDSGCRKMVIRMVKVLREIDPTLKPLTSYLVKTVVMNMDRDVQAEWTVDNLGDRFVDVLNELKECLFHGYLPHHVLSGNNLLADYNKTVQHQMERRLSGLLNSQQKMMKVLSRTPPSCVEKSSHDQDDVHTNRDYYNDDDYSTGSWNDNDSGERMSTGDETDEESPGDVDDSFKNANYHADNCNDNNTKIIINPADNSGDSERLESRWCTRPKVWCAIILMVVLFIVVGLAINFFFHFL